MVGTILLLKRFWKWIVGGLAVIGAVIAKAMYDNRLREEGRREVTNKIEKEEAKHVTDFYKKQDEIQSGLGGVDSIPDAWDPELRKLIKKKRASHLSTVPTNDSDK